MEFDAGMTREHAECLAACDLAPVLQVKPQETPLQVAVEFAGGVQAEHDVPHELSAVFETQALPQR